MSNRWIVSALIVAGLLVCVGAGQAFVRLWFQPVEPLESCRDRYGEHLRGTRPEQAFYTCVDTNARLFLEKDFAETKDLSKAFLTLLTAILVASITFSDRIVDISRSSWWTRAPMFMAWVMLLIAIILAGVALALMAQAAGYAAYFPETNFRVFEDYALWLFVGSGVSFGTGLVALLIAGIASLMERTKAATST